MAGMPRIPWAEWPRAEADGNHLALWLAGITVAPGPFMLTTTLGGPLDER